MTEDLHPTFANFISAARSLFAKEPNLDRRWQSLTPLLQQLLGDLDVRQLSKAWPDCIPTDRAVNLLFYQDPDYGFVINGLVHVPNAYRSGAQIHDHAHIYTLYGCLDGAEIIKRYERLDDGAKPDYALVRQTDEFQVKPGMVDLVKPWLIHTEINTGERAVAVIVRSQAQGTFLQGRYDPTTNRYWQGLGPRYIPYKVTAPAPLAR